MVHAEDLVVQDEGLVVQQLVVLMLRTGRLSAGNQLLTVETAEVAVVVLQFQVALLPEEKPLTLVSDVPAGQLGIWLETSWLGIGLMTDLVSSDPVQVVS